MFISDQLKKQHLLWRAGFGPAAHDIPLLFSSSGKDLFPSMVKSSGAPPVTIDVASNFLKEQLMAQDQQMLVKRKELSEEERKMIRRQNRDDLKKLNLAWLNEMVNGEMQLREKMALFWHGHFACRQNNVFFQQLLLDVVRRNALGSFSDLLKEVSKTAAMINFLNNNQNRKGHPNENFAREVMELFTMGRGTYSEEDIKEAARAFTGWGANARGEYILRKTQHDDGSKTFLKRSGNFTGDDVLDILLEEKATARFITRKIYRYFINETVDQAKADWLSERFYKSGYSISGLMKDIFTSDFFYEAKNIGSRIKSPVELIVGIRRMLPMAIENEDSQLLIQRVLGQLLFYPPNVAGWPGGKNWIDSSSLMFRLRLPRLLRDSDEIVIKPKDDDDQMMGMKDARPNTDLPAHLRQGSGGQSRRNPGAGGQTILADINWDVYTKSFERVPRQKLQSDLSGLLLQAPSRVSEPVLNKYIDPVSRESFIKTATIRLMSTPEYQMC
jgi:uncharacterized protein (DUF1800 family)